MAFDFDDASSQALSFGDVLDTSPDLTVSAWVNVDDTAARHMIASKWEGVSGNNRSWLFEVNTGGTLRSFVSSDGTFQSGNTASSTGTLSAGTWAHCVCVFDGSNTDIRMYLNGSSDGTDTTSAATIHSGTGRLLIGAEDDQGPAVNNVRNEMDGKVAEFALFGQALTAGDAAQLATGASPLFLAGKGLILYCPLVRARNDLIGGLTAALVGTPSASAHSPVIYPTVPIFMAAAAAAGTIAPQAMHYKKMRAA